MEDKIKNMKGKIVKEIKVLGNDDRLVFMLDNDEEISFDAYGDCCSESWIEHFDELKEAASIIEFKEIEVPASYDPLPSRDHTEDCMKYYFYELVTDKGSYMIEMRNSSNGYYGGYLQ